MTEVDVAIVGSSPNALAAAARLARAGRSVVVVEPGARIGGPVATDEFAPGFSANTGMPSATLDPEIASVVGIELEVVRRTTTVLGAKPVTLRALSEIAGLADAVALVCAIDRLPPPELTAPGELAALGSQLLGLGERAMHEVLRLVFVSVRDACGGLSEAEQAALAGIAMRARAAGPFAPGTLFGVLRHGALDDAMPRSTVRGGVHGIVEALADAARHAGAIIRESRATGVTIDVEGGVALGLRLASGERIAAPIVLSDLDARATFTRLVSPTELEPEHKRALRSLRYRGTVARIHLALRDLPRFRGVDDLRGTLVVAGSLADLERNWDSAKRGALPERPYIELTIPTLDDPQLAPAGQHVVDLWVQHVPTTATDREAVLALALDAIAPYADLRPLILHQQVALPRDLEARFGLTEGNLYGGELSLEQSFLFRRYETPVRGLYLCGSAAHPGGYSGRSGWNLAGQLLAG